MPSFVTNIALAPSSHRLASGSHGLNLPSSTNVPGPSGFVYGMPDRSIRPYGAASTVNVTQKPLHATQRAQGVLRGQRIFQRALPGFATTPQQLFANFMPGSRGATIKG